MPSKTRRREALLLANYMLKEHIDDAAILFDFLNGDVGADLQILCSGKAAEVKAAAANTEGYRATLAQCLDPERGAEPQVPRTGWLGG